jgi:hypothetical protein
MLGVDGSKIGGASLVPGREASTGGLSRSWEGRGADGSTVGSSGFGPCADVAQTIAIANSKPNIASGVPMDCLKIRSP